MSFIADSDENQNGALIIRAATNQNKFNSNRAYNNND